MFFVFATGNEVVNASTDNYRVVGRSMTIVRKSLKDNFSCVVRDVQYIYTDLRMSKNGAVMSACLFADLEEEEIVRSAGLKKKQQRRRRWPDLFLWCSE